ncbi:MAG: hypothetical protein ACI9BD_001482, partial [Candidatus Marinamargulisbacteria bacterium]
MVHSNISMNFAHLSRKKTQSCHRLIRNQTQ